MNTKKRDLPFGGFGLLFVQLQDQKPVAIVTIDRDMLYRAGELDHFFEPAVSDLELVMRNAFTAGSITTQSADAQESLVNGNFNICWSDSGQVDFHDPTIVGAVDIGGGTPQTARRPPMAIVANHAEVAFKRFAGHKQLSSVRYYPRVRIGVRMN